MSLVNDMLRDLEHRQAPLAERVALDGLQPVDEGAAARRTQRRRLWQGLFWGALLLAAVLTVRWLNSAEPVADPVSGTAVVTATPVAAPAAAPLAATAPVPQPVQLLATLPQQGEGRFVLQLLLDRAPEYLRSEQSGVVSLRLPHLRLADDGPRAGRVAQGGRSLSWSLQPLAEGAELLLVGLGDELQVHDRLEPAGERWQLWVEVPLAAEAGAAFDLAALPVAEPPVDADEPPATVETAPKAARHAPAGETAAALATRAPQVSAAQVSVASHRPDALAEARQALLAGDRARAIALLEQLNRSQPDNREALRWLARAWLTDGRGERLLAELPAQLARFPADSELRVLLARAQLQAGDSAAAVATLAAQLPPLAGDPAYHALLAAGYQQTGQWQDSARVYRNLVLLRPEQASWQLGLGIALEQLGERVAASRHYRLALQGRDLDDASRRYAQERAQALGGQS